MPIPQVPANQDRTTAAKMKQKYGEIPMLDFPQWTKDNFPGVTRMDLFSGLFGDVTDDSMFITAAQGGGGGGGFDPMSASGRKWLDKLANTLVTTGTKVQHISNNAPFGLADFGSPEADARRKRRRGHGQTLDRRPRGAEARVDADELAAGARAVDPAECDSAGRRRVSAEPRNRPRSSTRPSSRQGDG
jgi:hypothetical protein